MGREQGLQDLSQLNAATFTPCGNRDSLVMLGASPVAPQSQAGALVSMCACSSQGTDAPKSPCCPLIPTPHPIARARIVHPCTHPHPHSHAHLPNFSATAPSAHPLPVTQGAHLSTHLPLHRCYPHIPSRPYPHDPHHIPTHLLNLHTCMHSFLLPGRTLPFSSAQTLSVLLNPWGAHRPGPCIPYAIVHSLRVARTSATSPCCTHTPTLTVTPSV